MVILKKTKSTESIEYVFFGQEKKDEDSFLDKKSLDHSRETRGVHQWRRLIQTVRTDCMRKISSVSGQCLLFVLLGGFECKKHIKIIE